MSSELRKEPIIGRWVIVRTENILTPEKYIKENNSPRRNLNSVFAYGREYMTPPEVDAIRAEDTHPNNTGWKVRVVPNKFPALKIEGELDKRGYGVYDLCNGVGAHEVVIETPDPFKRMADFSVQELANVFKAYQRRCEDLAKDQRFKYIAIFKNFGRSAGASLEHEHSQIIALPMVPKYVKEKIDGSENYYRFHGRSIYEDILQQEYTEKTRIITENEDFVAFCPYAQRYAFETWILPKNIESQFLDIKEKGRQSLSGILKECLLRMREVLSNPSYNYYLQIQPTNYKNTVAFLWHIEIVPKLQVVDELEWDSGFYVVHTPPEVAAKYLREAVVPAETALA
ncbi:MAG: galactose-1-phosphate uridylyltransferase [Candidatus Omnitrophica bacterium]|nr:galactose-1-phosphate uridylyltransferase [Candidatus Omnitrophota bacterium]